MKKKHRKREPEMRNHSVVKRKQGLGQKGQSKVAEKLEMEAGGAGGASQHHCLQM